MFFVPGGMLNLHKVKKTASSTTSVKENMGVMMGGDGFLKLKEPRR